MRNRCIINLKTQIFSDFFLQTVTLSLAKETEDDDGLAKGLVKSGGRFAILQRFIFRATFLNGVLDGNGPQSRKTLTGERNGRARVAWVWEMRALKASINSDDGHLN